MQAARLTSESDKVEVHMCGQLGDDTEGKLYKEYLTENHIKHDLVSIMQKTASG